MGNGQLAMKCKDAAVTPLRLAANAYYRTRFRLGIGPRRFLFLLGHMRSGSSLLTNILNTNPDICGIGETHLSYPTKASLHRLASTAYRGLRKVRMPERYLLDKILHNRYTLAPELLFDPDCRFLFLVREPPSSISSMMRAFPDWWSGRALAPRTLAEIATGYYEGRLRTLGDLAERIGDRVRALFVSHQDLLHRTGSAFATVEQFLELRKPLSDKYDIVRTTGKHGVGDTSEYIRTGRIVRDRASPTQDIPTDLAEVAQRAHDTCCDRLRRACATITTADEDRRSLART